jgi:hypothetical protein
MLSRRLPLITNVLQWRTEFHSTVQMDLIHCMEQSLYIRYAVANSPVWLVLRRYVNTTTWLPFYIKKKEREILNNFSKNYYTVLHTICTPRPLKTEFFCHTSPFEARAPCSKEKQGDVYSQQSQTPSHSSKQWRTQEFCSEGVQQIQLRTEDRQNGDLGGSSPLIRGSGGSCNLVQEISFHTLNFS